jgi:hypothetical protein
MVFASGLVQDASSYMTELLLLIAGSMSSLSAMGTLLSGMVSVIIIVARMLTALHLKVVLRALVEQGIVIPIRLMGVKQT